MAAKTEAVNGLENDVAEEAQRQAVEDLRAARVGKLGVTEAFGITFPVTPFLSWDNGEISGPFDNWRRAPLTVEHLLLAVEALSVEQRALFFAEVLERMKEGV